MTTTNEVREDLTPETPAAEPVEVTTPPVRPENKPRWRSALSQVHGFWAFLIILLSAAVAGFADPAYGWNWMSLRLLITFVAVFIVLNYGGAIVKRIFGSHRGRGSRPHFSARPIYLVIILLAIAFGRGSGIEPALVFGSVLALDYGLQASGSFRGAMSTIAGAVWAALLGLSAFAAYSFLVANPITGFVEWSQIDPNAAFDVYELTQFGNVALGEFFAVLSVAALTSLPISLLPLALFEGSNIWRWNKIVWVATYAVGAALYSYVLAPLPASWDDIGVTFSTWGWLYLAYAIVVIALWAYVRFTAQRPVVPSGDPT